MLPAAGTVAVIKSMLAEPLMTTVLGPGVINGSSCSVPLTLLISTVGPEAPGVTVPPLTAVGV